MSGHLQNNNTAFWVELSKQGKNGAYPNVRTVAEIIDEY